MRRFNFINRSTLFTPASYANVITNSVYSARNFTARNNVKKLIENIHDKHFSGEFSDADIADLQSSLARSTTNYFQLLNVNPELEKSVFERELKQKYHTLCLRFHPDCTAGNASKTEIFELIKNAYEKLSDQKFRGEHHFFSSHFEVIEISMKNLAPFVEKHNSPPRHIDSRDYQYDKRSGMYYKYEGRDKNPPDTAKQKIATAAFIVSAGLVAALLGVYAIYAICLYAEKLSDKDKLKHVREKLVNENSVRIADLRLIQQDVESEKTKSARIDNNTPKP